MTYVGMMGVYLAGKKLLPFSRTLIQQCKDWQSTAAGGEDTKVLWPKNQGSYLLKKVILFRDLDPNFKGLNF